MSRLIASFSISSQFGLVSIRDLDTEDQPTAETGEEDFLFLPGHLFVATRNDSAGEVQVDVMTGGEEAAPGRRKLIDEVMRFPSSVISITDAVDPDRESVRLPKAGEWRVRIYVEGHPRPHRVILVLDEDSWGA